MKTERRGTHLRRLQRLREHNQRMERYIQLGYPRDIASQLALKDMKRKTA